MDLQSPTGRFFVISGPSGSGKTTICRQIATDRDWYYSVSHTTRPKRENEVNGRDYFFVTTEEFQKLIDKKEFYEWAKVYGNFYGTSQRLIEEKLKQGQSVILDVDTQGAAQIKKKFPKAVLVFIDVPELEVLKQRLVKRGKDSQEEMKRRLQHAADEMAKKNQYDHVILNDDLGKAISTLNKIINKTL